MFGDEFQNIFPATWGHTMIPAWYKASWYRKGQAEKVDSDSVPRTYVSRSLGNIKWPPINFKYAIENCTAPPPLKKNNNNKK